jgi:Nucleoside-diphosphate-sugar pyrophosphorylase involved in lipopolysaccharide biosynthesis/translation initiation factor 2B, gamma/epsilon subunits (eIF-2Bgamma/eIF-2Bepsilon)
MSKRAVVLAGGKGSRLRPYTVVLPKPLMPIGEYPILEVIVRQLVYFGFDRITLAVNHQADIVKAFFQDGSKWGASIDYSFETMPLSTIAPLKLIADLPENFLLLNGDVLTDLDLDAFYTKHVGQRRLFTISASRREHTIDYGVLDIDSAGRLSGFREKPSHEYLVSMGIYGVNKRILDLVPGDRKYGFDDLMTGMLAAGLPVDVEPYSGEWLDIGRPDDYIRAIETFEQKKDRLLPPVPPNLAARI